MFIYFLDPKHKQTITIMVTNRTITLMREINTINVNKIWPSYGSHTLLRWSTAPPTGKVHNCSVLAMQGSQIQSYCITGGC